MKKYFLMITLTITMLGFSFAAHAEYFNVGDYRHHRALHLKITDPVTGKTKQYKSISTSQLYVEQNGQMKSWVYRTDPISEVPNSGSRPGYGNTKYDYNVTDNVLPFIGSVEKVDLITNLVKVLYPKAMNAGNGNDFWSSNLLQMAIWKVLYDGGDFGAESKFDFGNHFGWKADFKAAFQDALSGNYQDADVKLYIYKGNGTQNLIGFDYTPAATPVPAAVWLLGTGLAGMLTVRHRMRHQD